MNRNGWIMPYIKENKRLFIAVIFLGTLTVLSAAALLYTSGFLISRSAQRPENILMVYVPIVAVRTFGVARSVLRYTEKLLGHHTILHILSQMRTRLYEVLEPGAVKLASRFKTGDLLGMMAEDIEHLQDVYLKTVFPAAAALFSYFAFIFFLGFFSISFAVLMAFYGVILIILLPLVSLLAAKGREAKLKRGRIGLYSSLTDAVYGISDWIFSGRQQEFIQQYEQKEQELLALEQQERKFRRRRDFAAQAAAAMMIVSMLLWAGSERMQEELAPVFIAAFVLVLFPLTEALFPLSEAAAELPGYKDSIKRLEKTEANPPPEKTASPVMPSGSDLYFKNVAFHYGAPLIKDLSLTLKAGTKTALLGPSGAGKSTILKLMLGACVPESGSISVCGLEPSAAGEGIHQLISVLNQKPHLFDTTIMNNIRLGNPEASDEEVHKAAELVGLHGYISSLPEGYHTQMHETGMRFSGGERQRIALARILLQDTPVIVLDEPSSGLDPITERELLQTIFRVLEGKTILWITHHLTGAESADQILFLDSGTIQMAGTHKELLYQNSRYRKLYELDSSHSSGKKAAGM